MQVFSRQIFCYSMPNQRYSEFPQSPPNSCPLVHTSAGLITEDVIKKSSSTCIPEERPLGGAAQYRAFSVFFGIFLHSSVPINLKCFTGLLIFLEYKPCLFLWKHLCFFPSFPEDGLTGTSQLRERSLSSTSSTRNAEAPSWPSNLRSNESCCSSRFPPYWVKSLAKEHLVEGKDWLTDKWHHKHLTVCHHRRKCSCGSVVECHDATMPMKSSTSALIGVSCVFWCLVLFFFLKKNFNLSIFLL